MSGARVNEPAPSRTLPSRASAFWRANSTLVGGDRQHHDVVGAGCEDAPREAVRRAVREHDDGTARPLGDRVVDQVENRLRLAGAGDHEQVVRGLVEPDPRLVDAGDQADDLDLVGAAVAPARPRPGSPLRRGLRTSGFAQPCAVPYFTPASRADSVAVARGVRDAPTCGRNTSQILVLSEAKANFAAWAVGTRRMKLPAPPTGATIT